MLVISVPRCGPHCRQDTCRASAAICSWVATSRFPPLLPRNLSLASNKPSPTTVRIAVRIACYPATVVHVDKALPIVSSQGSLSDEDPRPLGEPSISDSTPCFAFQISHPTTPPLTHPQTAIPCALKRQHNTATGLCNQADDAPAPAFVLLTVTTKQRAALGRYCSVPQFA
ncbi:hypothetical protein LZ30DRAFT_263439 [Colletotrichum cereale]|nr:hypothetical protein LZ30DRAFT_263439 [Colletotrichum cereale]